MSEGTVHSKLGWRDKKGKFHLAAVPEEELEEARAEAAKLGRTSAPFSEMSPSALTAVSAAYYETACRDALRVAEKRFGEGSEEAKAALRRLAVTIRDAGRHREAFALLPDDPKFRKGAEAIERPEEGPGAWCDCEPFGELETPNGQKVWKPLYSDTPVHVPELGGASTLWRCKKCNWVNITANSVPPQDDGPYQKEQQRQARALRQRAREARR